MSTRSTPAAQTQHSGRFAIIPARAIDDPRLGKAALLVLCALGTYSDRDGWSWPSLTTLANRLSVSRRHVTGCVRRLEELGYVETKPRFDKAGKQQTSAYRILHDGDLPVDLFEGGMNSEFTPRGEPGVQGEDELRVQGEGEPGVHPERPILTTHMNDTASGPSFEAFWRVYPKRTPHSDPKQPAKKKFEAAVNRGVPPATIVRGAQNYALYIEREGVNPKYVAQAQTWLNQERWEDHQEAPTDSEREVAPL